jgi:hypothetical protein
MYIRPKEPSDELPQNIPPSKDKNSGRYQAFSEVILKIPPNSKKDLDESRFSILLDERFEILSRDKVKKILDTANENMTIPFLKNP